MKKESATSAHPWRWIPSCYFAQGVPYMIVTAVSVVILKKLGLGNDVIAFWTSLLALPWMLKPLWAPLVDLYGTRKKWVLAMQGGMALLLAGGAAVLPLELPVQVLLGVFLLLAFASATHDAATDGFYLIALNSHDQAFFTGIRSTFYRLAMVTAQGVLIMLAGVIEARTGLDSLTISINGGNALASEVRVWESRDFYVECPGTVAGGTLTQEEKQAILEALKGGDPEEKIDLASGASLVKIQLKTPPEHARNVSFGRVKGSKKMTLFAGDVLAFTPEDWNSPRYAVILADSTVTAEDQASFQCSSGNVRWAWAFCLGATAVLYLGFMLYHLQAMPQAPGDVPNPAAARPLDGFVQAFRAFFLQKNIGYALFFLLFYRLGESQLGKLSAPFLLDSQENGGLALSTFELGLVLGTIGVLCLIAGGVLGGILIARNGFGYWLWYMILAINLPDIVYVLLAYFQVDNLNCVALCVGLEQFGYGFGFTAYTLFMVAFTENSGPYKTSHMALMTGLMALGLQLPAMASGYLQEKIAEAFGGGYFWFFVWVMLCTIPSCLTGFAALKVIRPDFGVEKREA